MEDVAFVAAVALLALVSWVGFMVFSRLLRRDRLDRPRVTWRIDERSIGGRTHVRLERVVAGPGGDAAVDDVREVGSVDDDDPEYDDRLLTLRAQAEQRLAVVDRS